MKRTRSNSLLWLIITLLCAAACTAARFWHLRTGFEGALLLPIRGALSSIAVVCVYILAAAVLAFMAGRQKIEPTVKETPQLSLYAKEDPLFMGLVLCSAFLSLLSSPFMLRNGLGLWREYRAALDLARTYGNKLPGGDNGILLIATAVTSALSFIALLVVAKTAYRNTPRGRQAVLFPVISNCLWLMEIYRNNAADPIRWDYGPQLLAIAFGILFYLDWAGLHAGMPIPRRTLWSAAMTIVCSAAALADGVWSLSSALLLISQTLSAFALLWRIPDNLRYPPELPPESTSEEASEEDVTAEEKLEEETHE